MICSRVVAGILPRCFARLCIASKLGAYELGFMPTFRACFFISEFDGEVGKSVGEDRAVLPHSRLAQPLAAPYDGSCGGGGVGLGQ